MQSSKSAPAIGKPVVMQHVTNIKVAGLAAAKPTGSYDPTGAAVTGVSLTCLRSRPTFGPNPNYGRGPSPDSEAPAHNRCGKGTGVCPGAAVNIRASDFAGVRHREKKRRSRLIRSSGSWTT
jgi:hypothetical protein